MKKLNVFLGILAFCGVLRTQFGTAQELPPPNPFDPICSWTFSDIDGWSNDLGYKPISHTNLFSSEFGDGTALVVNSTNAAWLRFKVNENDGTTNLLVNTGSLLLWFAPMWSSTNAGGTGPGTWGRFIDVGAYTTNASFGWWSLYTDPWGGNVYFSAQTNNGSGTNYLSSPISWATNYWHLLVLTYSPTNTALYIDGTLATNAPGLTIWPGPNALTNGFYIGSATNGTDQAHGMFDDLAVYSYILTPQSISNLFFGVSIQYWANPLNPANIASAPWDPPVPEPGFRAIMGTGYVHLVSFATNCVTNSSVWLTNVTAKLTNNGTMNLTFKIGGGAPGVLYDIYGADGLVGNSITNAQWSWLGQGYSCSTYAITNLPGLTALFMLGSPQDDDGDGLPNAFEVLVSKTNPHDVDSYGTSIPDWWQFAHFGTNILDPYGDADGDGWLNVQEYQNGTDPGHFDTPPPPQNVMANSDITGTNITVTWKSGGGPVTNYVVEFGYYDDLDGYTYVPTTGVGPTTFNYSASLDHPVSGNGYIETGIRVRAYSTNGLSAVSYRVGVSKYEPRLTGELRGIRGPGGHNYLLTSAVPSDVAYIHFFNDAGAGFNMPMSDITNGIAMLPGNFYWLWAQAVTTNGVFGTKFAVMPYRAEESLFYNVTNFVNAAAHLKENLKFLLRSASRTQTFAYSSDQATGFGGVDYWTYDNPEEIYLRAASSTNYEYYGYHTFSPYLNYSFMHELRPIKENILWSNFVYNVANVGYTGTGSDFYGDDDTLARNLYGELYSYSGTGTETNLPFAPISTGRWLYYTDIVADNATSGLSHDVGITTNSSGKYLLGTGIKNCHGLNISSAWLSFGGTLLPGVASTLGSPYPTTCYFEADAPVLTAVGYYFASQTRFLDYYNTGWPGYGALPGSAPALPGSPTFSLTNSPPLFAGFGVPLTISGWAKNAISNGYSNHFAYLEQYFDKAYTMTNGLATSLSAGILSPYGEFFPTMPGPVAILTMPDIDTGMQGTGVVNVIKVQLDVNHDGVMDLSYNGPDNTSPNRPFTFWVNNDYDRSHVVDSTDTEQDDLELSGGFQYGRQVNSPGYTDCESFNWEGKPNMACERDLEDFTRLWIPGLSNLVAVLTNGYVIRASLIGEAQIRLFRAAESTGGSNYLFDEFTGSNQVVQSTSLYVGLLTSNSPIIFTGLTNNTGEHFLWCGSRRGKAEIHLEVLDSNTNMLTDSVGYIDIKDIKELYERWTVGDVASRGPYEFPYRAEEEAPIGTVGFQNGTTESTNSPYILLVHGWNMKRWEKDRFAETAYKRLYWRGYSGQFGIFRWPTDNGFEGEWDALTDRRNYDRSEFNAWKSASLLSSLLRTNLNKRHPGQVYIMAHSMGNVVASEALRLATNQVVNTYIASQAAVPAHAYDGTITPYSFNYLGFSWGPRSPNLYSNLFVPNALGAARRINFYNTNDYALQRPRWELNQLLKPDQATVLGWTYVYDGYPYDHSQSYSSGTPDDSPPWDHFEKQKGYSQVILSIVSDINDRYEVFAYAGQSRSSALGRTPNVGNLDNNVNLARSVPFRIWPPDPEEQADNQYSRHKWHSAQFRSTNMRQKQYWQTLLSAEGFGIVP